METLTLDKLEFRKEVTAEQIKNLSSNRTYRALQAKTSDYELLSKVDSPKGVIKDLQGNTLTITDTEVVDNGSFSVQESNGTTSKITITDAANLRANDGVTLSKWFKLSQLGVVQPLIDKSTFGIGIHSDNKPYFRILPDWVDTNFPTQRGFAKSFAELGGYLYFAGSGYGDDYSTIKHLFIFDGASWTTSSDIPDDYPVICCEHDGYIAVGTRNAKIYKYIPGSNTWVQLGTAIPDRSIVWELIDVGGTLFAGLGIVNSTQLLYKYDDIGDSWSATSAMPSTETIITALTAKGTTDILVGAYASARTYEYNIAGDSWTYLGDIGSGSIQLVNDFIYYSGEIYAIYGWNTNTSSVASIKKWVSGTTWTTIFTFSPLDEGLFGVEWDGTLFFGGDENYGSGTNYGRVWQSKSPYTNPVNLGRFSGNCSSAIVFDTKLFLGVGNSLAKNTDLAVYYFEGEQKIYGASALTQDDKWHLLTATFDESNMYLYLDGVQVATQAFSGKVGQSYDDLYYNYTKYEAEAFYKGLTGIGSVREGSLTDEEVMQEYTKQKFYFGIK